HVVRVGRDRARRGRPLWSTQTGHEGDVLRMRRGVHLGEPGGAVVAAKNTIWLCPGQGAQKVGMAQDLADRFPEARETLQAIDETLRFPLSRLMFEGPEIGRASCRERV